MATQNLSAVEHPNRKKATRRVGTRRFRPGCERLEQREVLSTVASSTVGGVLASFSLNNGVLWETKPGVGIVSHNAQGLFQAADSTGYQLAYCEVQNTLYEFTPSAWVNTGLRGVSQVAVDGTGQLSARLSNGYLYSLNDASSSYVSKSVTAIAVDSAGELVALQGNTDYFYTEGGLETSGGIITSNGAKPTYAIDSHGILYTVLSGTLTSASSSLASSVTLDTGVTRMAMTSGGAVIVLEGPHAYSTFDGGIGSTSRSPGLTYALDGAGNLYTLQGGTLTGPGGGVLATGVTQMAMTPGGAVIVLEGPHAYSTFDNGIGTTSRSPGATYTLDSAGNLYTLQGGTLSGPGGTGPNSVLLTGVTQMATTPDGTVIVLQGPHSYSTFNAGIGTTSRSPGATYVLVGAGHLYTLQNGTLTGPGGRGPSSVLATNVVQMFTLAGGSNVVFLANGVLLEIDSRGLSWVGQSGTYASDGSIWCLGVTPVDRAGDYAIYRFSKGHVAQMPLEASSLRASAKTVWITSRGTVYSWSGTAWTPLSSATLTSGMDNVLSNALQTLLAGGLTSVAQQAILAGLTQALDQNPIGFNNGWGHTSPTIFGHVNDGFWSKGDVEAPTSLGFSLQSFQYIGHNTVQFQVEVSTSFPASIAAQVWLAGAQLFSATDSGNILVRSWLTFQSTFTDASNYGSLPVAVDWKLHTKLVDSSIIAFANFPHGPQIPTTGLSMGDLVANFPLVFTVDNLVGQLVLGVIADQLVQNQIGNIEATATWNPLTQANISIAILQNGKQVRTYNISV